LFYVFILESDVVETNEKEKDTTQRLDETSEIKREEKDLKHEKEPTTHEAKKEICVSGAKQKQENVDDEKWCIEKAVEMSYKEFCFQGTIIYSHNIDDCNILCEDIITNLESDVDTIVGFDTEWPVTYVKGKQEKTALIQICLSTSKCYLFHISCMPKFPIMLRKLLENHSVKKVGLNVEYDFWKLDVDFDIKAKEIIQKSLIELKTLGNKKLRSAENWSLEGLARNALHVRISKDPNVRTCDWRQFPLSELQQRYAATDAIVSLMLYQKLISK
jgi:Werner syndrome ATP-dependent helicase